MKKRLFLIPALLIASSLIGCSSFSYENMPFINSQISSSSESNDSKSEDLYKSSQSTFSSVSSNYSSNSSSSSSSNSDGAQIDYYAASNPEALAVSISILANKKSSDSTHLYKISGYAQYSKTGKYGQFDIADSTGYIYVFGASKNSSTITKSGYNYSFTNDATWSQMNIVAGDYITMEGIMNFYTYSGSSYGYPEFQGYITSVTRYGAKEETKNYTASETYTGSYYSSVDTSSSGNLLKSLHNLMDTTHTTYTSYSSLLNHFKSSDPGTKSGYTKEFYSGKSVNSNLNREHIWPKSSSNGVFEESYAGADIHHLRPADSGYNSARSNSMFGEIKGKNVYSKTLANSDNGTNKYMQSIYEPADDIKGDIARILMYVYTHYSSETGGNSRSYYGNLRIDWVAGPYITSECWKMLRRWSANDPVDQKEKVRNEYAYSKQGNRNPFIDHPSYADIIWNY